MSLCLLTNDIDAHVITGAVDVKIDAIFAQSYFFRMTHILILGRAGPEKLTSTLRRCHVITSLIDMEKTVVQNNNKYAIVINTHQCLFSLLNQTVNHCRQNCGSMSYGGMM